MASTSVKVALRVRPLSAKELLANAQECISYTGTGIPQVSIAPTSTNNASDALGFSSSMPSLAPSQAKSFTFDHVFDTASTQDEVYIECVKPLVDRFLEGFNATVLAYGQTGSGKTYSMGTGLEAAMEPDNRGIVPRAIYYLFESLQSQASASPEGFKYEVSVSFLELYNEELVDLLNTRPKEGGPGWGGLSIREDGTGKIMWYGVKEQPVSSPDELLSVLERGSYNRTTGSTDMNASSSRSHAIFSVILKQEKWVPQSKSMDVVLSSDSAPAAESMPVDGETTSSAPADPISHPDGSFQHLLSKFHFVDLAGSERLKRTNAEGDRKKEGISINQGLLALGNVISALGDDTRKSAHIHVPYRDSKLTRMLQDSLGGNSQTLMLACVSPSDTNYGETVNTLNYANRARNIKNKVVINQEFIGGATGANVLAMEREIRMLRATVAQLKSELQQDGSAVRAIMPPTGDSPSVGYGNSQMGSLAERNLQMRLQRERELEAQVEEMRRDRDATKFENERLKFRCFRLQDRCRELGRDLADAIVERDRAVVERSKLFTPVKKRKGEESGHRNSGIKVRRVWDDNEVEVVDESEDAAGSNVDNDSEVDELGNESSYINLPDNAVAPVPEERQLAKRRNSTELAEGELVKRRKTSDLDDATRKSIVKSNLLTLPIFQSYVRTISDLRFRLSEAEDKLTWYNDVIAKLGGKGRNGRNAFSAPSRGGDGLWTEEEIGNEVDMEFGIPSVPVAKQLKMVEREEESAGEDISGEKRLMRALRDNPELDEILKQAKMTDKDDSERESSGQKIYNLPRTDSTVWEPSSLTITKSANETILESTEDLTANTDESTSDMYLALAKIQADIAEHEKLVSIAKNRDVELAQVRKNFEQKIQNLQTQLLQSKKERDLALKRMQVGEAGKPDEKKGTIAIKQRYEATKRALEKEIENYRRKIAEKEALKRNQENLTKSLKDTIGRLNAERNRMAKDLNKERARARSLEMSSQREIANLRKKERKAADLVRKLEQKSQLQRIMLQRRTDEMRNRRSVMKILKRTTTPNRIGKPGSGSASPKRRSGSYSGWKVSTVAETASSSRATTAGSARRTHSMFAKPGRSTPEAKLLPDVGLDDDTQPVQVRARLKKEILDKELANCVKLKRAKKAVEDLGAVRGRLIGEQRAVTEERAKWLEVDESEAGFLDDHLAKLDAEIGIVAGRIAAAEETLKEVVRECGGSELDLTKAVDVGWENALLIMKSLDPFEMEEVCEMYLEELVGARCAVEDGEQKVQELSKEREKKVTELLEELARVRKGAQRVEVECEKKIAEVREEEKRRWKRAKEEERPGSLGYLGRGIIRSCSEPADLSTIETAGTMEELVSREVWVSEEVNEGDDGVEVVVIDDNNADEQKLEEVCPPPPPPKETKTPPRSPLKNQSVEAKLPSKPVALEQKKPERPQKSFRDMLAKLTGGDKLLKTLGNQVKKDADDGKENCETDPTTTVSAPATPTKASSVPNPRTPSRRRDRSVSRSPPKNGGMIGDRATRHDRPATRDGYMSPRSLSVVGDDAGNKSAWTPRHRSPSWTYGRESPRIKAPRSPSTSPRKRGYLSQGNIADQPAPPPFLSMVNSNSKGDLRPPSAGSGIPMATSRPSSGGDVFERLAHAHTLASQAKVKGSDGDLRRKHSGNKGDLMGGEGDDDGRGLV